MSCITLRSDEGKQIAIAVNGILAVTYYAGAMVVTCTNGDKYDFQGVTKEVFDKLRYKMEDCK